MSKAKETKKTAKKTDGKTFTVKTPDVVVKKPSAVDRIKGFTKSAAEYMDAKRRKKMKRIFWWTIFAAFVAVFFVFAFLVIKLFPGTWIAGVAEQNIKNVLNFPKFFENNLENIFRSISTIILIVAIVMIIMFALRLASKGSNRRKTVLSMFGSFIKYLGAIIGVMVVLGIWGVNATTLLASAGVIGIIIGFGAQSLVSDILSGVFIVFENNFAVGDIITFNGFRGEVVEIGIRTTKIKNFGGDINVINNSEIRNFINMTKHRSLAICDVTIEYGEDLERVEKIIRASIIAIAESIHAITDGPHYWGVAEFSDRGTVLRIVAKCDETARLQTTRDLNRAIKLLFDKNKIKIAVPQVGVKTTTKPTK